jgi:small subunit ribosomal protein S8
MDPIADMLVQIKNAALAGREEVVFPYSKFKHEVIKVLASKGYLENITKKTRRNRPYLSCYISYLPAVPGARPQARLSQIKKVSKPSRRIYKKVSELQPVRQGYGLVVVSTSKGLMAEEEARKQKLGGEVIFQIW